MAAEKKLSKKQQKAEAFKKRAKKPQFTDDMAVPESDEIMPEVVETEQPTDKKETTPVKAAASANGEKRKAEAISVPTEGEEEPHKKKNRRSKKSSNIEGSRYIVFVGKFVLCS
jgi:nucleolar protein 6